jgi:hypothetical protein
VLSDRDHFACRFYSSRLGGVVIVIGDVVLEQIHIEYRKYGVEGWN